MDVKLQQKAELFVKNRDLIKSGFKMNYVHMHALCAFICTNKDAAADPEKIKECRKIISKNTGIFSQFKDLTLLATASSLSLAEQPETLFKEILDVYQILKANKFRPSPYLTSAAVTIAENMEPAEYEATIEKAYQLYREMKSNHPFLTSTDDYGFAVMLAMSEKAIEQLVHDMEECYAILKKQFGASNALQAVSHVLSMSPESPQVKCERAIHIYNRLKEKGCKLSVGSSLSVLGALALLPSNTDQLIDQIVEFEAYLKTQKGFGSWGVGKAARLMYAASFVSLHNVENLDDNTLHNLLATSVTKAIIAIQIAILIAVTSTTTVATTSGNGSS